MARSKSFRVGRVTVYARGSVWYLRYYENTQRHQVRGCPEKDSTRQMAARVNARLELGPQVIAQLESGASTMSGHATPTLPELRRAWLDHHEHVLRSSLATINRYRTASEHLLRFVRDVRPVQDASQFREAEAEAFVRYLRELKTSPNGHRNTARRKLRDKGLKFVLMVCRTMFHYAIKRHHLRPGAENPFTALQIGRMPVDDAKPITLLSAEQECQFFEACDDWQLPVFATLILTGVRPGELTHLLLPDDVDLEEGWLNIRNKPALGWQVKTRNQRRVPLLPEVVETLKLICAGRTNGLVFRRRRALEGEGCDLSRLSASQLAVELAGRCQLSNDAAGSSRQGTRKSCQQLWRQIGMISETRLRNEFMKVTTAIGLPYITAPKTFRHMFATALMEGNVDPLIRNQLMGHIPAGDGRGKGPLGMTAVYTHASPATIRRQMEAALTHRPCVAALRSWLAKRHSTVMSSCSEAVPVAAAR